MIAKEAGMRPSAIRRVICQVLLVPEDLDNWSEYPNIWGKVVQLINDAKWYQVYDIAEALYPEFDITFDSQPQPGDRFQQRLNDFLVENGIGWQLQDGKIARRGSEAFDRSTHEVPKRLEESGFQRVANEMREALRDISRRPQADITGAIQHAMAALEATTREVAGQPNPTLGKLIPALNLPAPLDQAVHKLWGYASEYGRHIREQQDVDHAQAELIVTVAGSLCASSPASGDITHSHPTQGSKIGKLLIRDAAALAVYLAAAAPRMMAWGFRARRVLLGNEIYVAGPIRCVEDGWANG